MSPAARGHQCDAQPNGRRWGRRLALEPERDPRSEKFGEALTGWDGERRSDHHFHQSKPSDFRLAVHAYKVPAFLDCRTRPKLLVGLGASPVHRYLLDQYTPPGFVQTKPVDVVEWLAIHDYVVPIFAMACPGVPHDLQVE